MKFKTLFPQAKEGEKFEYKWTMGNGGGQLRDVVKKEKAFTACYVCSRPESPHYKKVDNEDFIRVTQFYSVGLPFKAVCSEWCLQRMWDDWLGSIKP
jgi:hypothetical protein